MLEDIAAYLIQSGIVVFASLTVLWLVSVLSKDASLVDIFWGFGFFLVGAVCLYVTEPKYDFIFLLTALPMIWGLRLTAYLAKRNLGHGEDKRYVDMRGRAESKGMTELAWRMRSLFTIYWGQGLLIVVISTPIWLGLSSISGDPTVAPPVIGAWAVIGTLIWLVGFLFEAISDNQLAHFLRNNKNFSGPAEQKPVMDQGLWKYTRHPNYFGNACMWWGIWLIACQTPIGIYTIVSPILMTWLLTKVSGRDLLERTMNKRKNYQDYITRTSSFFPLPPKQGRD